MKVDPNEIPIFNALVDSLEVVRKANVFVTLDKRMEYFNYIQQFIGACAEALEVKLEEQEND